MTTPHLMPRRTPTPTDAGAAADVTAAWVRRHQRGAWRYLRFLGGEPAGLEDILQDALLAAVEKGVPDKPDPLAAAWLRATVRNLFLMKLRTERSRPAPRTLTDEAAVNAAFEHYAGRDGSGDEMASALRECLGHLAPRSRQAVDHFYGDGASRGQIAAELNLSVEGVKTLLRRVKDELRSCIESKRREWA